MLNQLFQAIYPLGLQLLDRGLIPDFMMRESIRRMVSIRLAEESEGGPKIQQDRKNDFIEHMRKAPIAYSTDQANRQHYELPVAFFEMVLGKHHKYSCAYWPRGVKSLDDAEVAMLELYCERAQLENGQKILELGCGWGSLTIYLAKKYPKSHITAVSNSRFQKAFIEKKQKEFNLKNLRVQTADMNDFQSSVKFDRVISIEMFEHMRNWEKMFRKVATFMKNDALFFMHIFSNIRFVYPFEVEGKEDWMARNFFTGGIMPSDDLPLYFQNDLRVQKHWQIDGTHYQKTGEAWLKKMDDHQKPIQKLFNEFYGPKEASKWWVYWRVFFMACAEVWGFDKGRQWIISHYLFRK